MLKRKRYSCIQGLFVHLWKLFLEATESYSCLSRYTQHPSIYIYKNNNCQANFTIPNHAIIRSNINSFLSTSSCKESPPNLLHLFELIILLLPASSPPKRRIFPPSSLNLFSTFEENRIEYFGWKRKVRLMVVLSLSLCLCTLHSNCTVCVTASVGGGEEKGEDAVTRELNAVWPVHVGVVARC